MDKWDQMKFHVVSRGGGVTLNLGFLAGGGGG